jgi:tetratricopeptide (TPR) repeat protein
MVRRALAVALVVTATATLTAPARAQDAAAARRSFTEGQRLAAEERWVEALEAFEASLELLERPGTVFNVAAVLIRLGRARDAIRAIERFMEISDPRRDAAMRGNAEQLRAAAEESLQHVTLTVRPPGASVEVDGELAEGTGAERALILDPGSHTVAVAFEGYETERFALEPGTRERAIALSPLDGALVVSSTVERATVELDGEQVGAGNLSVAVSPGRHEVVIRADGYLDLRRSVEVAPGARVAFEAALEPVPADEVLESPLFWGLTAGGVALVIVVASVIAVATAGTEAPYGGNTDVVLAPLLRF